MKTGEEIILDYCNKILNTTSINHLQACKDIKIGLENGSADFMISKCPNNYGLDDFVGDCEIEDIGDNEQCIKCWNRALNMIEVS